MSEIREATALSDLETLKNFVPQWKQSTPEPFLKSAQQDVTPPTWNKLDMGMDFISQSAGGPSATYRAIVVQNGVAVYAQNEGTLGPPI